MRNYTKLFSFMILLLSFNSFLKPFILGQDEIISDNNKWVVSLGIFSGRPNPYYLLNNDEIDKIKGIISSKITLENVVVVKDREFNWSLLDVELSRYSTADPYSAAARSRIYVRVVDREGDTVHSYTILGCRILVYSNYGESEAVHEMADNELEKYLFELAYQKEEFSKNLLSPGEKEGILNALKSYIYEDSRRNRK